LLCFAMMTVGGGVRVGTVISKPRTVR
jgi:hypothetical protein